jgi:hypothetical protein
MQAQYKAHDGYIDRVPIQKEHKTSSASAVFRERNKYAVCTGHYLTGPVIGCACTRLHCAPPPYRALHLAPRLCRDVHCVPLFFPQVCRGQLGLSHGLPHALQCCMYLQLRRMTRAFISQASAPFCRRCDRAAPPLIAPFTSPRVRCAATSTVCRCFARMVCRGQLGSVARLAACIAVLHAATSIVGFFALQILNALWGLPCCWLQLQDIVKCYHRLRSVTLHCTSFICSCFIQ